MASMPASLATPGVSKSGSPISRCTISWPWASRVRARARTSKALSVPRRAMRLASRSSVGVVVTWLILVIRQQLLLAWSAQHLRHGIWDTTRRLLGIAHLKVAEQPERQKLHAGNQQHGGKK